MRVERVVANYRIKVRNLSPAGMMGAGEARVVPGSRVNVMLRGMEPVDGTVAWVQGDRFGVAFDDEVDCDQAKRAYFAGSNARSAEETIVRRPGASAAAEKFRQI